MTLLVILYAPSMHFLKGMKVACDIGKKVKGRPSSLVATRKTIIETGFRKQWCRFLELVNHKRYCYACLLQGVGGNPIHCQPVLSAATFAQVEARLLCLTTKMWFSEATYATHGVYSELVVIFQVLFMMIVVLMLFLLYGCLPFFCACKLWMVMLY